MWLWNEGISEVAASVRIRRQASHLTCSLNRHPHQQTEKCATCGHFGHVIGMRELGLFCAVLACEAATGPPPPPAAAGPEDPRPPPHHFHVVTYDVSTKPEHSTMGYGAWCWQRSRQISHVPPTAASLRS